MTRFANACSLMLVGLALTACAVTFTQDPAPVDDIRVGDSAPSAQPESEFPGRISSPVEAEPQLSSRPLPVPQEQSPKRPSRPPKAPMDSVIGKNEDLLVVIARSGDTASSLAERYLGSPAEAWKIKEVNFASDFAQGQDVIIPLRSANPLGVRDDGYQTVPILCYHRFGVAPSTFSITRTKFEAQMEYLAKNGYTVVPLGRLLDFLAGKAALPPKSVVITIDDGYRSIYDNAFPILRKYGFPATLFLYTDFVGARDALTWTQMREMIDSGLVDVQPHSKAHSNLAVRSRHENETQYRERVRQEVSVPPLALQRYLSVRTYAFAYPYGDADTSVTAELTRSSIKLGLTVTPGGNGFFAYPLMLRRTMVFGTDSIKQFQDKLQVLMPARDS